MSDDTTPHWKFLTNHASVFVCIAHDPGVRLREISDSVGITERAAHRIVDELTRSGYITRERVGRRNRYAIQSGASLPDRGGRVERIGDLLSILTETNGKRARTPILPPKPTRKAGSRV